MSDRLSFTEFKDEFLVRLAILSFGDMERSVSALKVASEISGKFPQSWIKEAQTLLSRGGQVVSVPSLADPKVSITGFGYEMAESRARSLGIDIEEEIDELENDSQSIITLRTSGPIIDHNDSGLEFDFNKTPVKVIDNASDIFLDLEREIKARIRDIRSDNELMTDSIGSQHAAELDAGAALLKASQADKDLIERLFIPSLTWFSKKLRDEAAAAAIKKLIALLVAWLSAP